MGRLCLGVTLIAAAAMLPAAEVRAQAEGGVEESDPMPSRTLSPAVLPLRLPRGEAGIAFGVSRLSTDPGLTSITGALYLETITRDRRFGIRMQLPVASADSAMVGDYDLDFSWIVHRRTEPDTESFLSLGLGFTVPTGLLNTLGGSRDEIRARRLRRYPTVSALNLLPIRYLQMLPHIGWAQRLARLMLYADVGGLLILACRFPNYYDSPQVEVALQYGIGAAYELLASGDDDSTSVAAGLELTGTHFFTTVAPTLDNAVGSGISPEPREDRASGLSLGPSVRAFLADRVHVLGGVAIALLNEQTLSRYTPSLLWQHDFTVFVQTGVAF